MDYIIDHKTGEVIEKQEIVEYQNNEVITEELIEIIDNYYMAKQRFDEAIKNNDEKIREIVKANGKRSDTGKSYKLSTKYYDFLVTEPTTRETFDSKQFKQDYPEVYKQYTKTSQVKEGLKIKEREYWWKTL